jgi:serine phosphatase RsbU (regulator of sigma subunit)
MKNFRVNLILRILLLLITVFVLYYVVFTTHQEVTTFVLGIFIVLEIISIIRCVDFTNRELSKFIRSINYSDFSQSFKGKNFGKSFRELNDAFTFVITQIQQVRSEKEENFQYLQTVVKHIGTGLISFTEDGKVEIVNDAAKRLLNVFDIKNIKTLQRVNGQLVDTINKIRTGEKTLIKIDEEDGVKQLSLSASEFKLRDRYFKLISLQDIGSEIEMERLARELEIAHQVQFNLLPKKDPVVEGYLINGMCHPAKEVGGDYYDFIELENSKLGIVIGDVSGKGLPAAFYMTLTKGIFQSSVNNDLSPKDVLIKVNKLLKNIIEPGNFVTMFYAVLDFANHKLTFARAGHEPAVYYNSQKMESDFLRPTGIGLGIKDGKVFENNIENKELSFNKGDIFVLYTDGFTDARNNLNEDFGRRRLMKFITENKNKSSREIIDNLLSGVLGFEGQVPQYDDMTIISIKRN